jgi:transcriptional regulator with XRE-family HTH domain
MAYPNIEAERVKSGMTKGAFAKAIDSSPDTIKRWQSGNASIPASKIVAMATLFNVTTDYLLGRTDRTAAGA